MSAKDRSYRIRLISAWRRYHNLSLVQARDEIDQIIERIRAEGAAEAIFHTAMFIDQRPEYIRAMRNTPGDGDQSDYLRWSGHAEARRQLATKLGWTVPHEDGDTTKMLLSET